MLLSRRTVMLSSLALAATPALAWHSNLARLMASRAPLFEWKPLREGAIVTGPMSTGGNVLAVTKGDAILFVDTKFAGLAPTLRAEAEKSLSTKTAMLINTHHHGDHTSGNVAFHGLTHIAHANAKPRIESQHSNYLAHVQQGPDTVRNANGDAEAIKRAESLAESSDELDIARWMPTKTVATAKSDHELDALHITLHHVGPGHTDNDLIVHLHQLNLIHAGDLLFHRVFPFIDRPAGAATLGWIESCRHMIDLCDADTIVIPGHGEVTDRTGVQRQIEFFQRAREAAKKAIDAGTSRDDFANGPFEFGDTYEFQRLKPRALGAIFDEISEGK